MNDKLKLAIIIASTRPGRMSPGVATWFEDIAKKDDRFELDLIDLAEIDLPMFDEPHPPLMDQYEREHTKEWAKRIAAAQAFVVVTPEYNFSAPPALVNAADFLHKEWKYKPVAFVGYGGVGAARAIEMEKQLFSSLHMVALHDSVNFTGTYSLAQLTPTDAHIQKARIVLDELHKWASALQPLQFKA